MSPTRRTLKYFRDAGYYAEVTEHWNAFSKHRVDLLGFCDVLVLTDNRAVAVQTTDSTSHSKRRAKILKLDTAKKWLACGCGISIVSWGDKPQPRVQVLTLEDF